MPPDVIYQLQTAENRMEKPQEHGWEKIIFPEKYIELFVGRSLFSCHFHSIVRMGWVENDLDRKIYFGSITPTGTVGKNDDFNECNIQLFNLLLEKQDFAQRGNESY